MSVQKESILNFMLKDAICNIAYYLFFKFKKENNEQLLHIVICMQYIYIYILKQSVS